MPIAISVTADGQSPIMALLEHLVGYDKKAMFDEIGAYGVSSTQKRFIDQSDVEGNPWKQSWRAKLQNGQTLRDTGRLMNSMTHNVLNNGVEWGTDVVYAAIHNFGGTIKHEPRVRQTYFKQGRDGTVGNKFVKKSKSNFMQETMGMAYSVEMPERSFLGINAEDDESILDIIGRHISG